MCGICQKAFTKNSSLKRHKTIVHLSTRFNCLTCTKTYRRREDLIKHSRICLSKTLDDQDLPPTQSCTPNSITTPKPATSKDSGPFNTIIEDLTISDSEDEELSKMAKAVENQILVNSVSRQTNTDITCLEMVDKATNTEPLIVISPDEILDLGNKLSLLTFEKNLKIFVDTLNSEYIFCKPKLSRGPSPTTQIGLLSAQPAASRGSQTKHLHGSPTPREAMTSNMQNSCTPTTSVAVSTTSHLPSMNNHNTSEMDTATAPPMPNSGSILGNKSCIPTNNPSLEEMCQRKPTRPSLFVPPCKRNKLASILKKE